MKLRERYIRIGLHDEWAISQPPAGWTPGRSGIVFRVEAPASMSDEECAARAYEVWRGDMASCREAGWLIPWHEEQAAA